jgi:hypothetical protein
MRKLNDIITGTIGFSLIFGGALFALAGFAGDNKVMFFSSVASVITGIMLVREP